MINVKQRKEHKQNFLEIKIQVAIKHINVFTSIVIKNNKNYEMYFCSINKEFLNPEMLIKIV